MIFAHTNIFQIHVYFAVSTQSLCNKLNHFIGIRLERQDKQRDTS